MNKWLNITKIPSTNSQSLAQSFPMSYLLAKLSGGTHNNCDGSLSSLQLFLVHNMNKHRPNKSSSFATASFCNTNHVAPRQRYRDALEARFRTKILHETIQTFIIQLCDNLEINMHYTWHWIGVGWVYSDLRIWCISCSSKPKWAKLVQGFGGAAPDTWERKEKCLRHWGKKILTKLFTCEQDPQNLFLQPPLQQIVLKIEVEPK